MTNLSAPFLANDHGDVSVFPSIDDMIAMIEPFDALDGEIEFFDARGAVLDAIPTEARWGLLPSSAQPRPEQLEHVLRSYFARLPERFAPYTIRAATSTSLSDLVGLCQELARDS